MRRELMAARALVEGGWSGPAVEPFCIARGQGVHINAHFGESEMEQLWLPASTHWTLDPHAEGLERYSVLGACIAAGADFGALERVRPDEDFQAWLQVPGRRLEDVLRVFTTAALRSNREKRT